MKSQVKLRELKNDPEAILEMIILNNPQAVQLRFQNMYDMVFNYEDTEGMLNGFKELVGESPQNGAQILYDLFGVDVIQSSLQPVGEDLVIEATEKSLSNNNMILKSTGGPFNPIDDDPYGFNMIDFTPSPEGTTGEGNPAGPGVDSGFNWNGMLNLFGDTILTSLFPPQNNNNNNNANNNPNANQPNQQKDLSWLWILVVIILIAVLLWAILRKSK